MSNMIFSILLAFGAGVSIVIQQALNSNLRTELNSAAWSGFVSYSAGLACMALLVIALRVATTFGDVLILAAGFLVLPPRSDVSSAATTIKRLTGAQLAGMPAPDTTHDGKLVLDRVLTDGDTIEVDGLTLRAVHTPGHSSNHLCFLLEETGMLFTGDHIMQESHIEGLEAPRTLAGCG